MSDMSPEGEALVRAGRRAFRPSETDRARVFEALRGRLGDAAMVGPGAAASVAKAGGSRALRLLMSRWAVVGVAALGTAGVFLGAGLAHSPPHAGAPEAPTANQAAAPDRSDMGPTDPGAASSAEANPARAENPATTTEPSPARPPEVRPAPHRQPRDGLSDEVALLSRAEVDLHAGHSESALKELDEHGRRFPHGALAEERAAARVQALCALGRFAEANAELGRLARTSPRSPLAERARQACGDAAALP